MPCSSTGCVVSSARSKPKPAPVAGMRATIAAAIADAFAPEAPVAQHDVGVADGGLGDAEAAARDPLVVAQAALAESVSAACANTSWFAANRLGWRSATPVAARKNVIWKP
jgi:hypothetical protein